MLIVWFVLRCFVDFGFGLGLLFCWIYGAEFTCYGVFVLFMFAYFRLFIYDSCLFKFDACFVV